MKIILEESSEVLNQLAEEYKTSHPDSSPEQLRRYVRSTMFDRMTSENFEIHFIIDDNPGNYVTW